MDALLSDCISPPCGWLDTCHWGFCLPLLSRSCLSPLVNPHMPTLISPRETQLSATDMELPKKEETWRV